ncbi:MAG TPA: hypothetical protein VKP88_02740, partial [Candidatus Paceibacterota bacterium]|nr:hypothetical protein [Candidatus Paceibacterota bacterium]
HPPLKRRRPAESEVLDEQRNLMTRQQLERFVTALSDPYPNAFITYPNGRLLLLEASLSAVEDSVALPDPTQQFVPSDRPFTIDVSDGTVTILKHTFLPYEHS